VKNRIALTCLTMFISAAAFAGATVSFDSAKGETLFHAVGHPSALNINGHGAAPKGQLSITDGKVGGTLTLDLSTLDTGIGTRTGHMKEKYLEVEKFPEAKLVLDPIALPTGAADKETGVYEKIPFTGKLTLHGVEKPVSGVTKIERKGAVVNVDATFSIDITDYKIVQPKFAGITIDKDVALEIKSETQLGK
jgi:polyisoprenoid-binding protein YceI